ncbi:hypothetical protein TNIN_387041 [Trichonephila inaurata madagascariensis]|uniref:Uncharacterized protein n=1 Tax=Trichonephila inaurata madagascariensis TaxID=2747483 RepID=A0A8X6X5K2_9ARAC|nr:hypothetical protein TNIN_387041 [Trichonephila inaurata madagascariensis]
MPDLSFIRKPVSVEDVDGSGSESEEENVQNTSDFEQETSVEDSEILNEYTHIQTEMIPCGPPEPLNASAFVDSSDALMIQILEQEGQMDIYENPEPLNTSAFPDNSKEEFQQEHQYLQQVEQVDQCDAPGPVSTPALENDSEEFQIEHQDLQQKVQTDRDPYDVTQKI